MAYIPNNAYLVRLSAGAAEALATQPEIQAVLPYEPYYKLKAPLLAMALEDGQTPLAPGAGGDGSSDHVMIKALLFQEARSETAAALRDLGVSPLTEQLSPFGPVLQIPARRGVLARLAALPGVQELEVSPVRETANDLTRVAVGVAANATTSSNYLGLTGKGVWVNVNDTGVDTNQLDLTGRVSYDAPGSGMDTQGHGTHVAGIIAGNGSQSQSLASVPGSTAPVAPFQFRGLAPGAGIYSVSVGLDTGPAAGDAWLQQTAARTNVLISNNSWLYSGDTGYDLAAASYDAAVRDALPGVSGSQPLLLVFAAGNSGRGADNGSGGQAGSIQSPATGKNVITVGALEHLREITNKTWTCTDVGGSGCHTNQPWLGMTDSSNQVAAFSSRGNVGLGIEGEAGRFKPDVVAPGTFIVSTRSGQWDQASYYAESNNLFTPMPDANAGEVLSNLNSSIGPFYRFESGTSLAAASVSGTLALMQEFFEQRLHRTNSPALMKALIVNGARSLGGRYDLGGGSRTNFQGWGLADLQNSIPAALTNVGSPRSPLLFFDQDAAHSLSTGQSHTRFVSLSAAGRNQPLRATLVWTDPPGNPAAGIKLVNDLDLIVTNLDTGDVFFGNDFRAGDDFCVAWDEQAPPNRDFVNNVENVYLAPGQGTNFSITVLGRRVSMNAVTADPLATAQDYALVISSGDGQAADALSLTEGPSLSFTTAMVTTITNTFSPASAQLGSILREQRIGAGAPLASTATIPLPGASGVLTVGTTNQWRFYLFSNDGAFTNLAFLTFSSWRLSPLSGVEATLPEADIDLYVSTNSALTNLDPGALASADKSVGRGGTETVLYSNALPGVYYVGVKCESQEGAEYSFAAIASVAPFSQSDLAGNELLTGVPSPVAIPGGSPDQPASEQVLGIASGSFTIRRAIVTNVLTCVSSRDLMISLTHGPASVVLSNFATNGPRTDQALVYDDSGEGDIPDARPTDGPGSLVDFAGGQALGQWRLSVTDTNQAATNNDLEIFLELQQDLSAGVIADIAPGSCRQDYEYLPFTATNLTAIVSFVSGTGPLSMQVCPLGDRSGNYLSLPLTEVGTNAAMVLDATSHPPLNPGQYVIRVCNLGPDAAQVSIAATTALDTTPPASTVWVADPHSTISDDAVSVSTLQVTNLNRILSAEVGARIDHPRVSDLTLRLVAPDGTRVLLDECRGGASTAGLGGSVFTTNTVPVRYTGGPEAVTNVIETDQTSGVISINYDFFSLPDSMHVYYDGKLLFDSGPVSGPGSTNVTYGPGLATAFSVVMNEGGNTNSSTAWFYSVTSAKLEPVYLVFTEDTNLTTTPIKFAPTPLTNYNYFGSAYDRGNGIYYLPEESLESLAGKSAQGAWTLEAWDRRTGATAPTPTLLEWQLALRFRNDIPAPIPLSPGMPVTNIMAAGQIQWYSFDAPPWVSFATNSLWTASSAVNLLFNQSAPPTGTNAGDFLLLTNSFTGVHLLQTNGLPPLLPGARGYLGVQNTNSSEVGFAVQVDFDVPSVVTLQNGVSYLATNSGPAQARDYFRFVVSTNAVRVQFEINGPTTDLTLVARQGLPLPGLQNYDYQSANPWTNDELIVVYDYSRPVPLRAGEWFLAAVNPSGAPAGYSILATEFSAYGTNILISDEAVTSSNICLTWTSLPGAHYFVEGKTNVDDATWVTISPTLTAVDVTTSECLDLSLPLAFFRVQEGLAITPPPLLISAISFAPSGALLQWNASTNAQFHVQWSPAMDPPSWTDFTNRISSPTGNFSFQDDGSQSGGIGPARFYRLLQLP